MQNNKTISIIIRAYNRREFIFRALKSIQNQIIKPDEVIIVSNFVIDDSMIPANIGCKLKRIINNSKYMGEAIYDAIISSSGDIISMLEDDDEFSPEKIKIVKEMFLKHSNIVLFRNNVSFIDDNSKEIQDPTPRHRKLINKLGIIEGKNLTDKDFTKLWRTDSYFNLSSMSIDRNLVNLIGENMKKVWLGLDFLILYLSVLSGNKVISSAEKLTKYREHKNHFSNSSNFAGYKFVVNSFIMTSRLAIKMNKLFIRDHAIISLDFMKFYVLHENGKIKRGVYIKLFKKIYKNKNGIRLFYWSHPLYCIYSFYLLLSDIIL